MINIAQNEEIGVRHEEDDGDNNDEEEEDDGEEEQNAGLIDEEEPHFMRQPRPGYIHAGRPDVGINGILKKKNFFKSVVIAVLLLLLLVCFIPITYFLIKTSRRSEQNFKNLQSDDRHVKKPQTFRQLSDKSKETTEALDRIKNEMVNLKSWSLKEITSIRTELLKIFEPIRRHNEELDRIHAYQKALDNWKETMNKRYEKQMQKLISQQAKLKEITLGLAMGKNKTLKFEEKIMELEASSSTNSKCDTHRLLFCLLFLSYYFCI